MPVEAAEFRPFDILLTNCENFLKNLFEIVDLCKKIVWNAVKRS